MVAPTTAPTRGEPALAHEVGSPAVDELGDVMPERPAVGERQILEIDAARVRRLDEDEHAEPVAREERLERVVPEVRVDRDRIGERPERRRVGAGVDGTSPRLASAMTSSPAPRAYSQTSPSAAQPVGAQRLEERGLRLDGDRDAGATASTIPQQNSTTPGRGHECGIGIEAHAQRARPCARPPRRADPRNDPHAHTFRIRGPKGPRKDEEAARRRPLDPRRRLGFSPSRKIPRS